MKKGYRLAWMLVVGLLVLLLAACATGEENAEKETGTDLAVHADEGGESEVIGPHQGLNQEPVPLTVERDGSDVYVEMTSQITDIEIDKGNLYKAWTFNGEAPGPVVVVNEGDTIHFTLENIDPAIPHSMDFHAVHAAPDKKFTDVMPNEACSESYCERHAWNDYCETNGRLSDR